MNTSRSWWAGARLRLEDAATGDRLLVIGSGRLAEMVSLAMTRPECERSRLSIQLEPASNKLNWPEIAALAERPDCPMII